MPTDAKELIILAANSNGLNGVDIKPWHLKAAYEEFDPNGHEVDKGIYEETWASETQFKRTFTGNSYVQTDYGSDQGTFRSGRQDQLPEPVSELREELIHPIPSPEDLASYSFKVKTFPAGTITLKCLSYDSKYSSKYAPRGVTYCLDSSRPVSLINTYAESSPLQVQKDRIVTFQGRFIPGSLVFLRSGKPILKVDLQSLEILKSVDATTLAPPSDAKLFLGGVTISGQMAGGPRLLSAAPPLYPPLAKSDRVSGTVHLWAVIGKDGHVAETKIIDGPVLLQQAARDAVMQWIYRPYVLNGAPVEFNTRLSVVFNLGL